MVKLLIRSADRLSNSISSCDFNVQFKEKIFIPLENSDCGCGCGGAKKRNTVEFLYAQIPNSVYNITSSNNSLNVNDGSATFTVTIPVGNYNASDLSSALSTALTTGSSGNGNLTFTVTYSGTNLFFTISAGGNFTLNFASASTTISSILGFALSNLSGAATYTGTIISSLYLPQQLEIRILDFPTPGISSLAGLYYSFIVPVNTDGGNIIEYTKNQYFDQKVFIPNDFGDLRIMLTQNGSVCDLNNADWIFILGINELNGCNCKK